jgi:hypothetical protein
MTIATPTLQSEDSATGFARARDGFGNGWRALGRSGQAMILFASLVAVTGTMLATASSAYAGSCTGTTEIASLSAAQLLPVA